MLHSGVAFPGSSSVGHPLPEPVEGTYVQQDGGTVTWSS